MTREIPLTKRRERTGTSPAADVDLRFTNIAEEYARLVHDAIARSGNGTPDSPVTSGQGAEKRLRNEIPSDRNLTDLASFIYRVAVTATIDAVRQVKTNRQNQPAAAEVGEKGSLTSPAPAQESSAQADEVAQKVREALGFLIESRRRAVGLSLEGFTIREIAELMSWSELKTRNTIYRGLKDLRRQLRSAGIDYETD